MANLDCLPFDVIECIIDCDSLSYIDLCRLSSVSKFFNCVVKSNKVWRNKYAQMWPELAKLFDASDTDWHQELRFRINIRNSVSQKLSALSSKYYYHENVSNEAFLYFKDISRNHSLGYVTVIDELESIIHHTESHQKLTHKYYGARALRYLRHAQLEIKWKKFLSQPSDKMSYVEGACLVSEWCQPTALKCTSQVLPLLEDLVQLTLEKIKQLFPNHPVLKQGMLKEDRISSSLWSPCLCKNILYCINTVLFQDMKFVGCAAVCDTINTFFIDEALKKRTGLSLTLVIIYSAVAAKLGVCCETVKFPFTFLLKWQEHPGLDEKQMNTYIDIMENGALRTVNDIFNAYFKNDGYTLHRTEIFLTKEGILPIDVFIKFAWYLVEFARQKYSLSDDSLGLCNALELICLLSPDDMEHKLLLARLFMHLKINQNEAISMLQEIPADNPSSPVLLGFSYQSTLQTLEAQRIKIHHHKKRLRRRNKTVDVKYAVGMVMRHKKYNFRCVIYGWDQECSASDDWIERMGVNKLTRQCSQAFYFVLVADGTNRYAAEENLEIDHENKPITHIHVGRYFESFHGTYYMLNEQILDEFPDDIEARKKALGQEK